VGSSCNLLINMGLLGNCCCGCLIHEDLFDRTDGTPLRGAWCEEDGDYEISSGRAKCLVAGAIAILNIQHPVPDGSMIVTFDTLDEIANSGQKYRVLVNAEITTSGSPVVCETVDYYFVEFERQGLNDSVVRLGIVSGGVETILKSDNVIGLTGTTRTVQATISEKTLCGSVSNAVLSLVGVVHAGLFADGYYSGFSLSAVDMLIDNFRFYQHHVTEYDCGACICTCDDKEWPPVLNVRIYPDPEDCNRLDQLEPCEFEIEYDRATATWRGSATCCDDELFDIEVFCSSYGGASLGINIITGCFNSHTGPIGALEDCETPCITFGPITVTNLDLTCFCSSIADPLLRDTCTFYIEVCG